MGEVFQLYSKYTGTGILMVLFFTALVFLALKEENRSTRTVLLYGCIALIILIFFPPTYYLYVKYVDAGTYWRLWWMLPTGIGLAYVGAKLLQQNKGTGLFLSLVILLLGGEFVYGIQKPNIMPAENAYQLPQEVIDLADFLDAYEENTIIYAAVPSELLIYMRQYDIHIQMPYGREMLDPNWGGQSEFFKAMESPELDFAVLQEWVHKTNVRFLVVNAAKPYRNAPEDYALEKIGEVGNYEIYEYTAVDWPAYFERINSTVW